MEKQLLEDNRTVRVWDRFVRTFHWSLVACVLLNFFVVEDEGQLHRWLGYTASALVLMRVVWGFIGTKHARFTDFFPTPTRIRDHLRRMRSGTPDPNVGHNPIGAIMMLVMMALVLSLGITGHLQTIDAFWGEEWLEELHEALASTLIACAGLHALAAVVMGRIERTNLVRAMITGIKVRENSLPGH